MKKRLISLLLAAVMLLSVLPLVQPKAQAHQIVMTAEEFIDCLWTAYNRPNYYYNKFPYNLGYYDGSRISFDCWNLGKAIIWSKGAIVNNYTVGRYAAMDTSCGLGDWGGEEIMAACSNCNGDFSNLVPGEWVYKENHIGYYIGNGKVLECTAGWDVWAITISDIDKNGRRSRNGVSGGYWLLHGMVPWLDYSGSTEEEETWIEKATFDPWVYKNRYDDLKDRTDEQLKAHWLAYGIKEGRCASAILDLKYYVDNNPDLKTAYGTNYEKAYQHFITKGYQEYRKSSLLFDGSYYCNRYPDVASSFKKDYLRHYVDNGMKEGRRASATFDVNYYLFTRPDVAKTWPDDLERAARHYAGYGIKEGRAGYDSTFPTITDVTVTDVSAAGYTVTCKVTDDWGVSKVAFPTWTVANDQDDLAADFLNTQKGTKNGNTYTFRVNASDHNNEGGKYVTHIYAVDKGGNTAKLVVDLVTVEDQVQTVVPTLTGKSFSLSFEDEILVNFYYEVSDTTDVAEQGMLVFDTNPGTASISKAAEVYKGSTYVASKGWYLNTTEGIAAKEMGDTRYYAAYAKLTDGSYVYSGVYDYSPKKYATNMLAKSSTSAEQKALCVAMLNYGAAAQSYFGYKTSDLMNAGLTASQKALVMDYNAGYFASAVAAASGKTANFAKTDGFASKAATVSFEGAFAVNYYFAPSASVAGEMQLHIWTPESYAAASWLTTSNANTVTMVKQSNGTYWAQVKGIPAKALDSTYYVAATYTDTAGNYHCTGVIAYSLSKYCMSKAADSTMGQLARATAMYGYYASLYFSK